MRAVFMTDKGKVRQHNEDNGGVFLNQAGQKLVVVADGMGGHRAGDVASEMTTTILKEKWDENEIIETAEQAEKWLEENILEVNTILLEHSKKHAECEGMGTTIVAAVLTELFTTVAHIGDSRCYIFNDAGFSKITEDHSLVNELLKSGQISKEDAENHPRKNVLTRALGTELTVEMDIKTIICEEEDILLLCSDGLSNMVTEAEMSSILSNGKPIEEQALSLTQLANEKGGEDNISLIIAEFNTNGSLGDER
jgi:protein phosphatase